MKNNQKGFGAVEALVIVVIVGLVAFGSWFVWSKNRVDKKSPTASTSSNQETKKTEKDKQDAYARYESKELGISFEYPYTWSKPVEEKRDSVTYVKMYSPDFKVTEGAAHGELASGGEFSFMVNSSADSDEAATSFNDFDDIVAYHDAEGGLYGVGSLGDGNTTSLTFNGVSAVRATKCGHPRTDFDCLQFIKDKKFYAFHYHRQTIEDAATAKYAAEFQHMLDSFKFE